MICIDIQKYQFRYIYFMSLEERINEEIDDLRANPHVATLSKTNNKRYEIIYSPKEIQSPYRDKSFKVQIEINDGFPDTPPTIRFIDQIYHLNISRTTGQVKMSVLEDDWSSFLSLTSLIESLDRILQEPEQNYPADSDVYNLFKHKKKQYLENVLAVALADQKLIDVVECQQQNLAENQQSYGNIQRKDTIKSIEFDQNNIKDKIQLADSRYTHEIKEFRQSIDQKVISSPVAQNKSKTFVMTKKPIKEQVEQQASINLHSSPTIDRITTMEGKTRTETEDTSKNNKTLHRINEVLGTFVEEINQLQKQMQLTNNKEVQNILKCSRDQRIEMIKQLVFISDEAKKKLIENMKEEVKRI